jgi:hypothetical protein
MATNYTIAELGSKATPVAADITNIVDTEDANNDKRITLGTIPAGHAYITSKPEITVGDMSVAGYTTLAASIATLTASGAERVLVVPPGAYAVSADTTVPVNVTLKVMRGAVLTIATTKTLTINGRFEAGSYSVFVLDGTGAVTFAAGSCDKYYPHWFGFSASATAAANSAAMTALIASTPHDGHIVIPHGVYAHNGFTVNRPVILSGATGKYASLGGTVLTGATIGAVLNGAATIYILGGATTAKLYNTGMAGLSINYSGATGNALQIENAIWTTLQNMKVVSAGDKGIYITGNAWDTRMDNLYVGMSKNGSIGIHTDNAGGGAQTQNVVVAAVGGATGITKVKIEGSSAQSSWSCLDAGPEDATGIGFHLYHTDFNANCDLHTPRFEAVGGGTGIKVEGVGGGTDYGKINVFGGHITGCDTCVDLTYAMSCQFNGLRFGRSVGGVFGTISNTCYGTTFINCNNITAAKDYLTDNGNYTTIISPGQSPYMAMFPAVSHKNPTYRKTLNPVCGLESVYGSEVTIAPASGYSQLIPRYVRITVASITDETVRVKIIGHKNDATDIDPVITKDFTVDGYYVMTNDEMIAFFNDGDYLTSIGAVAYTSFTPSASPSLSPSLSPSASSSESPSASLSPSASPSISPSGSPSASPSLSQSISPSESPSASLSPSISPSESPSASLSPSISPSLSLSLSPSFSPSASPSASYSPSASPSLSLSVSPSASPSLSPSISQSLSASFSPSISQSLSPSASFSPSLSPSASPSISPSGSPSGSPSLSPSGSPSASPSLSQSASPSTSPSEGSSPVVSVDLIMGQY